MTNKAKSGSWRFAIARSLAATRLLLQAAVACGPAEREIEATAEARLTEQVKPAPTALAPVRGSDATDGEVAQRPTATVAAGLELPQRTNPAWLATEK